MAEKDGRTEDPTAKRKQERRQEGQIARSVDLASWAAIVLSITLIQSTVTNGGRFLTQLMKDMGELIASPDQGTAMRFMIDSMAGSVKVVAPLALGFLVLTVIAHLAQVRVLVTFKAMKPQIKRLNPISGFKRIFSAASLFQSGKEILKMTIMGTIAYITLWTPMTGMAASGPFAVTELMRVASVSVMDFIRQVAVAGLAIGVIDYFWQRKQTNDGMKMSKDEVKQEHKQQDGSPEVKGKIRAKQRAMSRNRMMASIKEADVVVVNPVHVAVALKYDPIKGAPRVVAKGAGFVAEKIRERAEEHDVAIVQDIPLARTLHHTCDIDDEIPMEMFEAVAKVLAFVFSLRRTGSLLSGLRKMPGTPDLEEYEAREARKAAEDRFGVRPSSSSTTRS